MTTTATTIAVYGPNLAASDAEFHVHAPGCADTKKKTYTGHEPMVFDAASVNDMVDAVYPPGDFCCESGQFINEFKVFPCVKFPAPADGELLAGVAALDAEIAELQQQDREARA